MTDGTRREVCASRRAAEIKRSRGSQKALWAAGDVDFGAAWAATKTGDERITSRRNRDGGCCESQALKASAPPDPASVSLSPTWISTRVVGARGGSCAPAMGPEGKTLSTAAGDGRPQALAFAA